MGFDQHQKRHPGNGETGAVSDSGAQRLGEVLF